MLDVLRHDDSPALLKGLPPDTIAVQRERLKGGKTGDDSHRNFSEIWETGRPCWTFGRSKKQTLIQRAILCAPQPEGEAGVRQGS